MSFFTFLVLCFGMAFIYFFQKRPFSYLFKDEQICFVAHLEVEVTWSHDSGQAKRPSGSLLFVCDCFPRTSSPASALSQMLSAQRLLIWKCQSQLRSKLKQVQLCVIARWQFQAAHHCVVLQQCLFSQSPHTDEPVCDRWCIHHQSHFFCSLFWNYFLFRAIDFPHRCQVDAVSSSEMNSVPIPPPRVDF